MNMYCLYVAFNGISSVFTDYFRLRRSHPRQPLWYASWVNKFYSVSYTLGYRIYSGRVHISSAPLLELYECVT